MKSGEMARLANVNVETVRYYERRGLLNSPKRRASGYREYSNSDLARLRAIRHAQQLGFRLTEIRELLTHLAGPRSSCAPLRRRAELKIAELTLRIAELERARSALHELIGGCTRSKACPGTASLQRISDP